MRFPERLSLAIKQSGKTQLQVGVEAGISAGAMYNYATGKRVPDVEIAKRLADATSTTLAFLVGEAPNSKVDPHSEAPGSVRIRSALAILGKPNQEDLALRVGVHPEQVNAWIDGRAQPSHAQLVRLFNVIAEESEKLVGILQSAVTPASRPALKAKRQA
ncbi:MAG TPA: helix-turn-helix transcriptional regulator [Fibrobacteria bacterium]|nr:helix-turn-helix transcriptional regulator [Fibrobacteria bacterium]